MRLILSFMVFAVFGFVQQSCQSATTADKTDVARANTSSTANSQTSTNRAAATPEEAARISLAEAKKAFDANEAIFVDTRAEVAYKNEHIKGAINIPAEGFQTRYNEVPKDRKIIAYCS